MRCAYQYALCGVSCGVRCAYGNRDTVCGVRIVMHCVYSAGACVAVETRAMMRTRSVQAPPHTRASDTRTSRMSTPPIPTCTSAAAHARKHCVVSVACVYAFALRVYHYGCSGLSVMRGHVHAYRPMQYVRVRMRTLMLYECE
jgi:hypothetical protein